MKFSEIAATLPLSGHPDRQRLADFALGRLSNDELERCALHLQSCKDCSEYVQSVPSDPLVTLVRQAGLAHDQSSPRRILLKYEVLEEIGRGGMSVVYRARQIGLERTVALKQIKTDAITPEGVARFRAEAGAMARVRHPNIVQVYDFGEQDGRPYLACEFIAGGSLDRYLNGVPLPTQAAGQLIATLARALQVAHDQSIVHRDLKPSNVLLAFQNDSGADRNSELFWERVVPKIGDFGLAKLLDQVHGQTQTGDIMGTPGYMAPEQASGQVQEVGAGADIFSLGVILYELVTGRQPFRAATIIQTLELIRSSDPVSPRRLQPAIPRDLDVICLKCLEKDPHRRYRTAGDLADDLDRWLEQEPILARPVSAGERGWKWIRRHRAISGMFTVVALAVVMLFVGLFWHNHTLQAEVRRANANELASLSAYQQGYDVIQGMVEELFDQRVDTDVDDRQMQKLFEIIYAYHASTLEGADNSNPEIRFVRASSRFYLGAIHEQCGKWNEALPLLQSSRQEFEAIQDLVRDRIRLKARLAACCQSLIRTQHGVSKTVDATTIREMRHACQILNELVQARPLDLRFHRRRAGALHELVTFSMIAGQHPEAEQAAVEALAEQKSMERLAPLGVLDSVSFERTISFMGRLRTSQGRFDDAEQILRDGETMLMKARNQSDSSDVDAALADLFDVLCSLEQARGRILVALQHRTRSIELVRKILLEIPKHRFANRFLAIYQLSERELLSRIMAGDANGKNDADDLRSEIAAIATQIEEIHSLRIREHLDQAADELQKLETRLRQRRSESPSPALSKCLADMNFEWAELHIGRNQLDEALGRYNQCIALLNDVADRIGNRSGVADFLSNCHRLKAWHLSRAGLVDSAFAEWDLAVKTAVGHPRNYIRVERALERATLNDHAGAAAEADQVAAETDLTGPALLHLARVYSISLRSVQNDIQLESNNRRTIENYYADHAVSCLQRLIQFPDSKQTLLNDLTADTALNALRETQIYKSWFETINPHETSISDVSPVNPD